MSEKKLKARTLNSLINLQGKEEQTMTAKRPRCLFLVLTLCAACLWAGAGYAFTISSVVLRGDPAPGGLGTFKEFGDAATNDNGDIAFFAVTSKSDGAIFFKPAGGAIQVIAQDGQTAPGPVPLGTFTRHFGRPQINNNGDIAFATRVSCL